MPTKAASSKSKSPGPSAPQRLSLRISLRGIQPSIWREISIPDSYSLLELHRCIQLVFGWLDYHLFEFHVGSSQFGDAESELEDEDLDGIRLKDLQLKVGVRFLYLYDMGDEWEHDVEVTSMEEAPEEAELDTLAYLHDGARSAPPEDCGGATGYQRILATLALGDANQTAAAVRDMVGADFDPELFDRRATSHALMLASAWGVI